MSLPRQLQTAGVTMRSSILLFLPVLAAVSLISAESYGGRREEPADGLTGGLVVRVEQGLLRGLRIHRSPNSTLRTLYAFQGVPYARSPVGPLRFQDPVEAERWTDIRNATSYGPQCIQKKRTTEIVSGEEDCLYLNVFTADPPEIWSEVRRPVMIVIHGGAFIQWSGNMDNHRPDALLREGLVLVSMNYRLAVMGFLNTEDSQAPGNAGLKDQAMALRWVQRNIAAFGGDPSKVTIMGESAGGASVHYHMLSPLSRGLFQGAISVSGSVLPTWARVEHPRRNAEALRRRFAANCPDDAPDAIVRCLQRVNANELVFNQYDVPLEEFQNYFLKNTFLPSVEAPGSSNAPFLTEEPEQLLQESRFAKVPYMTGYTNGEGILFLSFGRLLLEPSRWAEVDEHFADIFRWEMPPGMRTPEMALRMRRFYLGDRSLRNASQDLDTIQRFVQMCTDLYFAVGSLNSARMMADRGATVYAYEFSRDGPIGFIKNIGLNASHIPGVMHGDDMAYVYDFTKPGATDPLPIPDSEVPIRERQVKIFANMVKFGNPTPGRGDLLHWPPFRSPQERYLRMDADVRVLPRAGGRRLAFWRQLAAEPPHTSTGRTTRASLELPSAP